jgi:hypothetical protein
MADSTELQKYHRYKSDVGEHTSEKHYDITYTCKRSDGCKH